MANPAPVIGSWYRKRGGETFEVVAIDPKDRTIEIQYFDGAVEEDAAHLERFGIFEQRGQHWHGAVELHLALSRASIAPAVDVWWEE